MSFLAGDAMISDYQTNYQYYDQYRGESGWEVVVYLTLLSDVDPGEAWEELQGREAGVEVGLPGRDEAVADQVSGSYEQSVGWVCRETSWEKIIGRKF